ncbi:hypothetical protein BLOT_015779 [Blomia tropicalis]|nr:hypothetical protein BLOT_015779 [Blomia tropicalis]
MGKCNSKESTLVPMFVTPLSELAEAFGNEELTEQERSNKSRGSNAYAVVEGAGGVTGSSPTQNMATTNNDVTKYEGKSQFLAQISAPSAIETAKLTTVYRVPDDRFENAQAVLKSRELELQEMLDEGGFAKVYKARKNGPRPMTMACKVVDVGTDLEDNSKLADVKNELFVLEKVKHPHVVRLYEHFIVNDHLYIFMDYADFGNLYRYLYMRQGPLSESDSVKPFAQLVSGIAYMHAHKMAHRDLKLSNILLKTLTPGNIIVLIADFGLSRVVYRRKTGLLACKSYCGTPNYMAPELKLHLRYNAFDVDMYALGVMLFVMVQAAYPFDADDDEKALQQALKLDIQWHDYGLVSEECRSLLKSLLEPNATKRLSMRQLITHHWLADELNQMKGSVPNVDELPKKTATRRMSSPGDDIRLRKGNKTNTGQRNSSKSKSADSSQNVNKKTSVNRKKTTSSGSIGGGSSPNVNGGSSPTLAPTPTTSLSNSKQRKSADIKRKQSKNSKENLGKGSVNRGKSQSRTKSHSKSHQRNSSSNPKVHCFTYSLPKDAKCKGKDNNE